MSAPRHYMAASVSRYMRQTKLGYVSPRYIIGSRVTKGDGGANLYFDVVMLPPPQFQNMRTSLGARQVYAPSISAEGNFQPGIVLTDIKRVTVPEGEPDPESWAKNYFMKEFGLAGSEEPPPGDEQGSEFDKEARKSTRRK